MTQPPISESERETRLNQVVADYLRALDAGGKPDPETILRNHPDLGPELNEFFAEHDHMDQWAEPLRKSAQADSSEPTGPAPAGAGMGPLSEQPAGQSFGDYEILEELARGGMGVVYRARHRKLDRIVALKMLRSGKDTAPADLQRFHNEAEAIASLDHPNIVPIYDVGEHEGRLFYSMKLMEGGPLSRHLGRFHANPREAARMLIPLARAIHYAHQHGILHRDLKPSNILLNSEGSPHVTDFGLLKRLGAADTELTRSGELVGTPGYMAPEQASGRGKSVTTASDVYGLGTILYGMLTARPPFSGDDLLDVLERVRKENPDPPTKINPLVDRDLELICLKCLEKEPQRRYPSALALADELQRYVEGRSLVLTRPIGTPERLWRWCRRNRALAALIGAVTLSILLVATVSVIAAISLKLANERERQSRIRAEENRDVALEAVNTFFTRVSENRQLRARGLEKFREDLLRQARTLTERLVRIQTDDARLQAELGNAYLGLGQITEVLGSRDDAKRLYHEAEQIFARLARESPREPGFQDGLGRALHQQGNLHQYAGRSADAVALYQQALSLREGLTRSHPENHGYQEQLQETVFQIGRLYQLTEVLPQAQSVYEKLLPIAEERHRDHPQDPRYQNALAKVYHNLGDLYLDAPWSDVTSRRDNLVAALANFKKALALGEQALKLQPDEAGYQDTLAQTWHHLGLTHANSGHPDLAEPAYLKGRDLRERLVRDHADVPDYQLKLATLLHGLGVLYMHQKARRPDAGPIFERALALSAKAAHDFPDDLVARREQGKVTYDAACYYALSSTDHPPAPADVGRALRLLRELHTLNFFGIPDPVKKLATDSDFKAIQSHPEFVALIHDLKTQAKP
jgi:tetratricopeptide (TPR) repeat protein/tRNA A-37 threonylcarbamoyl transferase component Bud32